MKYYMSFAFLSVVSFSFCNVMYPIILIPGMGGNQIEAKLDQSTKSVCWKKRHNSEYFTLWLDLLDLERHGQFCFFNEMLLHYNLETRTTRNSQGVFTRIPGFGNCSTVRWVGRFPLCVSYLRKLIKKLEDVGYQDGVSLRAAPHDFRKGPNEYNRYFDNLQQLIEDTYEINGNSRVILMPHSLGGLIALTFLHRQSKNWKRKYIRSMISLSVVYGGAVKAVRVFMPGGILRSHNEQFTIAMENEELKVTRFAQINELEVKNYLLGAILRSYPAVIWMFPSPKVWDKTEVIVQTKQKNYTSNNMKEFFRDSNLPINGEMYNDVIPFVDNVDYPGVEVQCLYGTDVKTVDKIECDGNDLEHCTHIKFTYGDGDGTVNLKSLRMCNLWKNSTLPVIEVPFPKVDHLSFVKNQHVLEYIKKVVTTP